jgi:hypothetical protein
MSARAFLGSARASRAGDGALAIADFPFPSRARRNSPPKDCFGEAPKLTREARVLPERKNHVCTS